MEYYDYDDGDSDVEASDEFNRREKERIKAGHSDDVLKYFTLCNKQGICPEDEKAYIRGGAEYDRQSKRELKEESDIEAMLGEEDSTKPKTIERLGFWKELYDLIKREMDNKRKVRGSISCYPNGFVQGRGYVAYIIYDFLGRKYKDIFVDDDKKVIVKEALDAGLENLVYYSKPFSVKKIGSREDSYFVQIENFKGLQGDEAYEIFEREFRCAAGSIPSMKGLLVKCWPKQYGPGRRTDLDAGGANRIRKIFNRKLRKANQRD